MWKKYFDKYYEPWLDRGFDLWFNHVLTYTSALAFLSGMGHYFFPHLSSEIDFATTAVLGAMRKGM